MASVFFSVSVELHSREAHNDTLCLMVVFYIRLNNA